MRSTPSPTSRWQVNSSVENIGARRLQTVMERVLDEISFAAPDRSGEAVQDRRRLCGEAHRRPRQEHRLEPVYPIGPARHEVRGTCANDILGRPGSRARASPLRE